MLSVVVAAALSGRIRMVSLIARVSCWLTKRAETLSDPLLTVSRDDDHGCCAVVDAADVVVGVRVGLMLVVCTVSVSRN